MPQQIRYDRQRPTKVPPHVSLRALRIAVGITLDELATRIHETAGLDVTRGALSAVENGHRGVSSELLAGIALAYGLTPDDINTDYQPRARATEDQVA